MHAKIGAEGAYYLSKAKWTSVIIVDFGITFRDIDKNDISDEGCSYLKETEWPQLS